MSLGPGVHRVLEDLDLVTATLTAAGWRTAVVPGARTTAELYTGLAAALDLPDYFGRNLDALWDCLTDLTGPTALVLPDWTRFARSRPERWSAILGVLRERTEQPPDFVVLLL